MIIKKAKDWCKEFEKRAKWKNYTKEHQNEWAAYLIILQLLEKIDALKNEDN